MGADAEQAIRIFPSKKVDQTRTSKLHADRLRGSGGASKKSEE